MNWKLCDSGRGLFLFWGDIGANTWFDRNKGGIGFALGMLVASAITIGLTYAVNQPR